MAAKKWDSYLGRDRLRRLLRDKFHDFYPRAAVEFFSSEGYAQRFLDAWRELADKSGSHNWNEDVQVPFARVETLASGATAPDRDEFFLVVDITWGDGTEACYGELDRPLYNRQVHAAVLEIGDIERQLAPDSDLQRNGFDITFADPDGEIASHVADDSWLGARVKVQIGHTRFAEDFWQKWGTWRIYRPPGHSPTTCTLSLEDAADELLEEEIRLPTLGDLAGVAGDFSVRLRKKLLLDTVGSPEPWTRSTFRKLQTADGGAAVSAENEQNRIPLALGDEIFQPALCWVNYPLVKEMAKGGSGINGGSPGTVLNPLAVVVLGASKKPGWEVDRRPYSIDGHVPSVQPIVRDWEVWAEVSTTGTDYGQAGIISPMIGASSKKFPIITGSDTGLLPYIEVYKIPDWDTTRTPRPPDRGAYFYWYVPVLFLCYAAPPGGGGFPDLDRAAKKAIGNALWQLHNAATDGKVYVRTPGTPLSPGTPGWGAEGKGSTKDRDHNAGAAIRYLLEHHTSIPRLDFHGGYLTSLDSVQDGDGMGRMGGHIAEDAPVREPIGAICRTWGVDLFINRFGKIGFSIPDLSPEDRAYLQKYVVTYGDEYDVVRGSFQQRQLVGNDRFGQASVFTFDGIKEHTKRSNPEFDERTPVDLSGAAVLDLAGRRIDKKLDVSFRPQPFGTDFRHGMAPDLALQWIHPRSAVRLALPISAGEDLGGWMNVEHGQWMTEEGRVDDTRTCRAQGIRLRWRDRVIEYDLVDEDDYASGGRDYILDDEELWSIAGTRQDGDGLGRAATVHGGLSATFAIGSGTVTLGFNPTTLRPRSALVGDILHAWGSAHAGNKGPWRITGVGTGPNTFTIDITDGAPTANEALDSSRWELQAAHFTRPDWQIRPTQYADPLKPDDTRLPYTEYGALGDDTVIGPSGEPGGIDVTSEDGYKL